MIKIKVNGCIHFDTQCKDNIIISELTNNFDSLKKQLSAGVPFTAIAAGRKLSEGILRKKLKTKKVGVIYRDGLIKITEEGDFVRLWFYIVDITMSSDISVTWFSAAVSEAFCHTIALTTSSDIGAPYQSYS